MDLNWLLLCSGALTGYILSLATADSVIVVSKRYTNNSYTCFARHTKDGLEYHLTYNVCYSGVATTVSTTGGIQCLYYECSIASYELMSADGRLRCFRYGYEPPSVHQPLFDRVAAFHREWPIARHSEFDRKRSSRVKRDFSWVSFLEKFSFMGRHQSTVNNQNEAYFHYNFLNNKPSAGGSSAGAASSGPPAPPPAPPVAPLPSEP